MPEIMSSSSEAFQKKDRTDWEKHGVTLIMTPLPAETNWQEKLTNCQCRFTGFICNL